MKHDIFELQAVGMTHGDRMTRVVFLMAIIAVICMDLFVWSPT